MSGPLAGGNDLPSGTCPLRYGVFGGNMVIDLVPDRSRRLARSPSALESTPDRFSEDEMSC